MQSHGGNQAALSANTACHKRLVRAQLLQLKSGCAQCALPRGGACVAQAAHRAEAHPVIDRATKCRAGIRRPKWAAGGALGELGANCAQHDSVLVGLALRGEVCAWQRRM